MKCIILSCQSLDFEDERDPSRRVVGINVNYSICVNVEKGYEVFKCFIPSKSPDYVALNGKPYPAIANMEFRSVSKKGSLVSVPCNFQYKDLIKIA